MIKFQTYLDRLAGLLRKAEDFFPVPQLYVVRAHDLIVLNIHGVIMAQLPKNKKPTVGF